jgi:hypothetical protein
MHLGGVGYPAFTLADGIREHEIIRRREISICLASVGIVR